MKKIMFNDKYGLTQAVLDGRKTMTRRIIKAPKTMEGQWVSGFAICKRPGSDEVVEVMALDADEGMINNILPKYKPGEVVAVAQSYNDSGWNPNTLQQTFVKEPTVFPDLDPISPLSGWIDLPLKYHKGWSNKMFVYAGLMPHQIRITNVRVERLQDISDEDCLREGIYWDYDDYPNMATKIYRYDDKDGYIRSKAAFAALIDKVSGKGMWQANPYCFCYTFELIR